MKVLFIYLHGIGDNVLFSAAVRLYQQEHSEDEIGILCLPNMREFWKANPHVQEVHVSTRTHPMHHGILPVYLWERLNVGQDIQRIVKEHQYDRVEYIVNHCIRIGNISVPLPGLFRRMFTLRFEDHQLLKVCKRLGIGKGARWPEDFAQEIFIPKRFEREAQRLLASIPKVKPMCIVHMGASSENKSLSEEQKDALIELLKKKFTVCVMQEESRWEGVHSLITHEVLVSAALIKRARLFVGIDSGPSHLADALGVGRIIIGIKFPPSLLYLPSEKALLLDSFALKEIQNQIGDRSFS